MAAGDGAAGGSQRRHDALLHQLAERLTAAGYYVSAAQRRPIAAPSETFPSAAEILERALAQLDEAGGILRALRLALDGRSHDE
jgi:hypothetical protein